ncbi:MAG: hypothetical protein ABSG86_08145 [Thermoguttaceae bacterium]
MLTPAERGKRMRRVRSKDTRPELTVRGLVRSLGFRYRLYCSRFPGTPDLVLPSRRRVIFVHGCFWHRHRGCRKASTPGTNREFWEAKFQANILRLHFPRTCGRRPHGSKLILQ